MTDHTPIPRFRWPVVRLVVVASVSTLLASPVSARQAPPPGTSRVTPEVARAPTPTPVPDRASDTTVAVENALDRYRLAFNTLDAAALKSVWPTVDARALARAFGQLRSQEITFADCQMTPNSTDSHVGVTCRGSIRFVPRIGRRVERVEPRRWQFVLRQLGGEWRLETVDSVDPRQ